MKFYFQSSSVKNSLICPKAKSATHCLAKLFPIYNNKHWIIRQRDNHTQSSHCQTVLYWRLLDFRWYSQLGPKLRPHVGLSNITTASEGLKIIQVQPFVSVLHFKITNYLRKWILVSKKSIIVSLIVDIFKKLLLALKIMKRIVTFCWFSNSVSIYMHK